MPESCQTRLLIVATLLSAAGFPLAAQVPEAQEPPPPAATDEAALKQEVQEAVSRLPTVVVTATRQEAKAFELPYRTAIPDRRIADRSRVVQDALRGEPGVVVQRTSYGQASPFLRNLTGYHTLLLIDGIRFNNSIWRSGPNEYWGTVDGLSLDHLEVVMGPGSVLYGSDAVGGTVNAIPLRRKSWGESSWDRRLYLRWSSAENSLTARAEVSGNLGDVFGFVVGGTAASFGELRAGGDVGRQEDTSYTDKFVDGRFDLRFDDHWSLGILSQTARVDGVSRAHRTAGGVTYHGTAIGNDRRHDLGFERHLDALFLEGNDLDGFADGVQLRLSFQRLEEDLDRIRSNGAREKSGFDVDTWGAALQLTSKTAIGRFTYGLDYYHDDVQSRRRNFNAAGVLTGTAIQGPVGDNSDYDLFGVFVQDEIALGPSFDWILGGRLTHAAADVGRAEDPSAPGTAIGFDDAWTSAVGSTRLLWKPSDTVHPFAGISQAFRAPNLSDLSRFDIALANELEIPATDLDPEDFLSFELGVKVQDLGGLSAEAAYWFTLVDDLVIRQPTGMMSGTNSLVAKRNSGDGHLQGVEFHGRFDFDAHWSVHGAFSWTDGQLEGYPTAAPDKVEEVFTRLAPIQGSLGVRWAPGDGAFWIMPTVLVVDGQERLSSQDRRDTQRIPPGGSPGYTIWSVNAGYDFDERKRLFLSVENIGDKNYRVHGSGAQEAGFNVVAGVDISF